MGASPRCESGAPPSSRRLAGTAARAGALSEFPLAGASPIPAEADPVSDLLRSGPASGLSRRAGRISVADGRSSVNPLTSPPSGSAPRSGSRLPLPPVPGASTSAAASISWAPPPSGTSGRSRGPGGCHLACAPSRQAAARTCRQGLERAPPAGRGGPACRGMPGHPGDHGLRERRAGRGQPFPGKTDSGDGAARRPGLAQGALMKEAAGRTAGAREKAGNSAGRR